MRFPRRRREPESTKLHVGAFDVAHDGWLNTDVTPHLAIARVPGLASALRRAGRLSDERWAAYRDGTFRRMHYLDLTRPLPYPDGAFEAAFGSHVLEHLTPGEAEAALRELHRVLRPGGIVRIAVPDLDHEVGRYDPSQPGRVPRGSAPGPRALAQPASPLVALQRALAAGAARAHGLRRRPPRGVPAGPLPGRRADRLARVVAVHGRGRRAMNANWPQNLSLTALRSSASQPSSRPAPSISVFSGERRDQ